MARKADPELEDRILQAAHKLWRDGGEKALSMRKVAEAARTTTPTLYSRFRNRQEILTALLHRVQHGWTQMIDACQTPQEAAIRCLDYALAHPREYELLYADWFGRTTPKGPRANIELMKVKLAQWFGGEPERYDSLVLAEWAMLHGASMLLITNSVKGEMAQQLRHAYVASLFAILRQAGIEVPAAVPFAAAPSDRHHIPGH